MIKRLFKIFALVLLVNNLPAMALSISEEADSAYSADNFQEAAVLYKKIIETEGNSPVLQYNLGNCYYRMGELGNSLIAYERALRLDPRFEEARINLEFVNSKIIDRPGESGSFLSNLFDRTANQARSNVWAWIGMGLFALTIASLFVYFFSAGLAYRKIGFFSSIVFLFLTLGALILSFRARQISTNNDIAIITSPSVILSTSPREPKDRNEEAMLLHEGTKVEIIDSVTSRTDSVSIKWLEVQIDNSHRAWIKSSDLERI